MQAAELRRMVNAPPAQNFSELRTQPQMLAWLAKLMKSVVTALPTEVESLQTELAMRALDCLK